ncbi:hypothetical protein IC582_005481 [Cucumis melo]
MPVNCSFISIIIIIPLFFMAFINSVTYPTSPFCGAQYSLLSPSKSSTTTIIPIIVAFGLKYIGLSGFYP